MKKKFSILYIDDEPANLRVFKNTFRWDYEVFTAQSGDEGLNYINDSKNQIDVLITDQKMPGITGIELLKKINKTNPTLTKKSILLSGYTDAADIEDAFAECKIFKYVSKPWDPRELGRLIQEAIKI